MKMSRRAKRMEQHHKRAKGSTGINLVSLMDIFTILVFFLLVNSSDGEVLPTHKLVELPESVSEEKPRETLVVMITAGDILIHGNVITSTESLVNGKSNAAAVLKTALQAQMPSNSQGEPVRQEATIMGDKATPYKVLKQVMASCTEAGFARISLAVLQKPLEET